NCPGARFLRVVSGDDDDRHRRMPGGERTLNIESCHLRHMKVEQNTVRFVVLDRAQEVCARSERLDRETGGDNESRQGNAHVRIVIHYGQQACVTHHLDGTLSGADSRSYWTLVQVSGAAPGGGATLGPLASGQRPRAPPASPDRR